MRNFSIVLDRCGLKNKMTIPFDTSFLQYTDTVGALMMSLIRDMENKSPFGCRITQMEIASTIGCSRAQVCERTSELKMQGILKYKSSTCKWSVQDKSKWKHPNWSSRKEFRQLKAQKQGKKPVQLNPRQSGSIGNEDVILSA
jgi:hypothetical protein